MKVSGAEIVRTAIQHRRFPTWSLVRDMVARATEQLSEKERKKVLHEAHREWRRRDVIENQLTLV